MSTEEKSKSFLSGLGRATLRGVRRCPNCGTYNGTRGLSCKNKKCNVVFKEKRKFSSEACKLVTGNSTQIYSIRVRDKSPDYRGFVRLPQLPSQTDIQDAGNLRWGPETALCFVDSCQRSFDTSILKCHEADQSLITPMCQHIEAAMKSENEASTLTLRNSILSSLNISNNLKQDIYLLASQTSGPLVQRVSKNVMAVKCLVTSKHPLGYLHFSFSFSKNKDKIDNKYYCSCSDFEGTYIIFEG